MEDTEENIEKKGIEKDSEKKEQHIRLLEKEKKSLDGIKKVQEELYRLNRSINSSISNASTSILNVALESNLDSMNRVNSNPHRIPTETNEDMQANSIQEEKKDKEKSEN